MQGGVPGDAGIVDEHVEPAKLTYGVTDDRLHLFLGGDVAGQPEAIEFVGGGLGGVADEIDQNHACAVRVQAPRDLATNALTSPRDDGDALGEQ